MVNQEFVLIFKFRKVKVRLILVWWIH